MPHSEKRGQIRRIFLQAFAVEVGRILAGHTLALQNIQLAVSKRRCEEGSAADDNAREAHDQLSLLEILSHTSAIRVELLFHPLSPPVIFPLLCKDMLLHVALQHS